MQTTHLSKLAGLILIVLALCHSAWAVSLAELQAKAVENRKIVKKYEADIQMSEFDENTSRSGFLPAVDATFTANQLDEDSSVEKAENSSLSGVVSYNIFSGFGDKYGVESAGAIKKSREYELENLIQDIKYGVAIRYLDVFGKKSLLNVAEDEFKLLEKRHQDAESRHAVGLIRKNELLKIKVDLDDAQQSVKSAKADFEKSLNNLAFEVDAPLDAGDLNFKEFDAEPEFGDYESCQTGIVERNDVKALEMVLASKKSLVGAERSAFYPSVDVAAGYATFGNDHFLGADEGNENELRFQLTASMNLFNGFARENSVAKANLDVKRVEYDLEELKKNLRTDLKNVFLDYEVSRENLKVAEGSISQAEENFRITDISFREGVETAADVLDAIYNLSRAKYNYINARIELFRNHYKLTRLADGY